MGRSAWRESLPLVLEEVETERHVEGNAEAQASAGTLGPAPTITLADRDGTVRGVAGVSDEEELPAWFAGSDGVEEWLVRDSATLAFRAEPTAGARREATTTDTPGPG